MKIKTLVFTLLIAVPSLAMAETKATDKPKTTEKAAVAEDDVKVLAHVKHVNDMEIAMGKLAKTNGTATTKAYGNTLVKDHTANNTKIAALVKKKGIGTLPPVVPTNEDEKLDHQKMMDGMAKLQTLKGAEFDKEFIPMMIEDHDKEVGRLDVALASVKDADIVTHLKATKPVVQKHADSARELQKKAVSMK